MKNKNLLATIIAVVVISVLMVVWYQNRPEANANLKVIKLEVISERDAYDQVDTVETEQQFLADLLIEKDLIEYQESDFGRFITAVQGMKSDDTEQYWWSIEVDGQSATLGMDELPLEDGKTYSLVLTKGY